MLTREIRDTSGRIEQLKEEYDQMEQQKSTVSKNTKSNFVEIWRRKIQSRTNCQRSPEKADRR